MAKQTFTFQLGTQVSEYARSVSNSFLCASKACYVNFELPLKQLICLDVSKEL